MSLLKVKEPQSEKICNISALKSIKNDWAYVIYLVQLFIIVNISAPLFVDQQWRMFKNEYNSHHATVLRSCVLI